MQEARGASLNDSDRSTSGYVRLFATVAVVVWALDQAAKWLAVRQLSDGPVTIVPHVFELELTRNPGAAFGTATGMTALLSVVAIVVCVFVVRASRRLRDVGWTLGLGFLLGGAVGNVTDRLFREPGPMRGHVVDFLYVHHWPVFNLADCAITVAAVLIFWRSWKGVGLDGTVKQDAS